MAAASRTVTRNSVVPNTDGVPLSLPLELTLNPDGNRVADQVYGGVPLNAASCWLYATPFNATGKSLSVEIVNGNGCQMVNVAAPTKLLFKPVFAAMAWMVVVLLKTIPLT